MEQEGAHQPGVVAQALAQVDTVQLPRRVAIKIGQPGTEKKRKYLLNPLGFRSKNSVQPIHIWHPKAVRLSRSGNAHAFRANKTPECCRKSGSAFKLRLCDGICRIVVMPWKIMVGRYKKLSLGDKACPPCVPTILPSLASLGRRSSSGDSDVR